VMPTQAEYDAYYDGIREAHETWAATGYMPPIADCVIPRLKALWDQRRKNEDRTCTIGSKTIDDL